MTVIWCPLAARAFMLAWNVNWRLMDGVGKIPGMRTASVLQTHTAAVGTLGSEALPVGM